MTEAEIIEQPRRLHFNWIPDVLFRPREAFKRITSQTNGIWLTPLLIISLAVLVNVLVMGRLKQQAALMGEITLPPDYQYYTPEQQAQYMQAAQATQGPVFVYVLPTLTSLLGVWFGWLLVGGLLHLITTLLGGRGSTGTSMNIVAWASIPFAIRAIVQILYMLIAQKIIINPGLSGFAPAGDSGWINFIGQLLKLIDVYIIWQIALIILGVRSATGLNLPKTTLVTILTILIILLLQAGLLYFASKLSSLTISRPFFF
jgi:hypothetical protein